MDYTTNYLLRKPLLVDETYAENMNFNLDLIDKEVHDIASQTGKKIKIIACVLRNNGTSWAAIDNIDHAPVNVLSVTNDTNDITITHSFTAKKVISFVACPDETFVQGGYNFGASVGLNITKINIFKSPQTIGGMIVYNGTAWNFTNTFGITGVSFSNGTLTITHNYMDGYICNANTRDGIYLPSVGSLGTTTSTIKFFDYAGNLITTPDTNMRVYFQRSAPSGKIRPDLLNVAGANIWCYGIFEVE